MGLSKIANYLEDDWGDSSLSSRSNSDEGYFLHPSDGLTGSGDYEPGDALKGVYRPEWAVTGGSYSTSNGALVSGGNLDDVVGTPSDMNVGSWKLDFTMGANTSNTDVHTFAFMDRDVTDHGANDGTPDNGYIIQTRTEGNYELRVRSGGFSTDLIRSSWGVDTVTHTEEVNRDSYADLELFLDGASQGTATDTTYSSARHLGIYSRYGNGWTYDNLVVS